MQIQIQSVHFTATEQLQNEAIEKLSKLEKLYDRIEYCNIILRKEKSTDKKKFIVEVKLSVPKHDLFASEKAESFERALDMVTDDLKRQIVKHKEKVSNVKKVAIEFLIKD
jgi:putative sigma-54 modulation protein